MDTEQGVEIDFVADGSGEFYAMCGHHKPIDLLREIEAQTAEDWWADIVSGYSSPGDSPQETLRTFCGFVTQGWMRPGRPEDYPDGCEWGDPTSTRFVCREGDVGAELWTYWSA